MNVFVEHKMEDDQQQPQILGGAGLQQHQQRLGKVQLGKFWPQAPNSWFVAAELKFEVANINSERELFAHSVGAMGFNILRAVMDLVENPPAVNPYTTLKGRLVLAHQLTPVQKATKCLQVAAGNNQRLSEVLASLLEFCLPGEEGTAFLRAVFTMRLLVAIQAHLTGAELTDLKELAQMADRLWLCHGPQPLAAMAREEYQSEDESSEVVAAIPTRRRPQQKQVGQQGHPKGQQGQQVASVSPARASTSATSTPSSVSLPLCGQEELHPVGKLGDREVVADVSSGPQRPTSPAGG